MSDLIGFLVAWGFIVIGLFVYADSFQTPPGMSSGDVCLRILITSLLILLAFIIVASMIAHIIAK
jgi:hypothetical protein